MQRLAELGLEPDITEMDVMLPLPAGNAALRQQAGVYRDALGACLAAPRCRSFSTWGATDRYSWIPGNFPGRGAALLFGTDGRPNPAYNGLRRLLHAAASGRR